jgi:hypothetical protein
MVKCFPNSKMTRPTENAMHAFLELTLGDALIAYALEWRMGGKLKLRVEEKKTNKK